MQKSIFFILISLFFIFNNIKSQNKVELTGYVSSENNAGFIDNADVYIYHNDTLSPIKHLKTDQYGTFSIELDRDKSYIVKIHKDIYVDEVREINPKDANKNNKIFLKIIMKRKPGYIFEINLTEVKTAPGAPVDGITGALVEVYNNTTDREITSFINNRPNFNFYLNKGNHYTILIRKKGYLAKQLEAYLNINGCIICFDGVSKMQPGVRSRLNEDKSIGSYLADIEMEKVFEGKKFKIKNIYYDLDKWYLKSESKKELNKLAKILKLNPNLIVELGSHTDSRGSASYNLRLSTKRAKAAVEYLVNKKEIPLKRISYKGYGETELVNLCKDGVTCSEKQHAQNRRTEIKILDIINNDKEEDFIPLRILKNEEKLERKLQEILNSKSKIIKYKETELPDEIKKDINKDKNSTRSKYSKSNLKSQKQKVKTDISNASINSEKVSGKKDINNDNKKNNITYKIVLLFTRYPLPKGHIIFKNIPDIEEYIDEEGGYVLYMAGTYSTFEEAKNSLDKKWKKLYKKAYITKFENNIKVGL